MFDKVKMQLLDLFGDLEIIWRAKGNMAKRKQEFLDLPLAIVEVSKYSFFRKGNKR